MNSTKVQEKGKEKLIEKRKKGKGERTIKRKRIKGENKKEKKSNSICSCPLIFSGSSISLHGYKPV
jgi:hypothetical protein